MNKKKGIIIGVVVLVVAAIIIAAGMFMSKGKPEAQKTEIDEGKNAKIEYKVEYGKEIKDETLSINTKKDEKKVKVSDLNPEVDTMKVGKTEHKVKVDSSNYDVFVIVKDTQKPEIEGVKETIKLKGKKVDVKKELEKLITAKDPVDGKVKVDFEIKENEKNKDKFDVVATATDKNKNTSTAKFEVIVENIDKEDKEEKEDETKTNNSESSKDSNKSNSSNKGTNGKDSAVNNSDKSNGKVNSNSNGNSNSKATETKPKQETKPKPKPESKPKPKPENKPKPKPENKPKPKPENKPKPKPENKPKPKPENKPKPKPETKPNIQGPSGSTLISEDNYGNYSFSYNDSSLPGGGKITKVVYSSEYKEVMIAGVDKSGKSFAYSSGLQFPADLSNDAVNKLQNVENKFSSSLN